jgi:hypothetical protein
VRVLRGRHPEGRVQVRLYPQAKVTNWESAGFTEGWSSDKTSRSANTGTGSKKLRPSPAGRWDDRFGRGLPAQARQPGGKEPPAVVDTREIPTSKIKWCRLTGAEILEEKDWLGKYIPIIPVFGSELNIKGKTTVFRPDSPGQGPAAAAQLFPGFVRPACGADDESTLACRRGADRGLSRVERAAFGQVPGPALQGVRRKRQSDAPPIRIAPSDIPAGYAQDAEMSEHDIQGALGMYNASLGERSNEKSGRAIMARQREGDTATFHYIDNLNRAIRLLGRILVDAIPKYYDSRRAVRILGEDGSSKAAEIDPEQQAAVQRMGAKVIYNLSVGSYDVVTEAGPSFTTKRQESADAMLELSKNNPAVWQTHGDLIVRSQDWPNAEEWAKRTLITMPPPLRQAIEQEKQGNETDEVKAVKTQAQQMLDQANQHIQAAEQALQQQGQELQSLKVDKELELRKLEIDDYRAETERLKVTAPAMGPEQVALIVQQTVQAILAQPTPSQAPQPPQYSRVTAPPQPPQDVGPSAPPQPNQPPAGGFLRPMTIRTCSSCAAFAALKSECRAKSPTPIVIEGPQGPMPAGVFPAVRSDSWCAEWRPDTQIVT